MKKYSFLSCLVLGLSILTGTTAYAQASLASEDIIEDVPVTVRGEKLNYSLVRDANQKNQWYYLPANIRLFEKTGQDGKQEPEFNMIKYQFKNPKNPQEILEGGILQFAVNMSPDNDALAQLRKFIEGETGQPDVRVSGLPLKNATAYLLTTKGEFVAEGAQTEGIAPTQANQKMIFSVPLTRIGTDVYEALTRSNTGMGVAVKYLYNGLTPPAGFRVTVDWDQTYQFLSKNEKTAIKLGYTGSIFGIGIGAAAKYSKQKQEIRQSLVDNKCITIEATTGETFDQAAMEKYLDPIIQKISEEIFQKSEMASRVDTMLLADALEEQLPTVDQKDGIGQIFSGRVGKAVAIKDISIVKKGKQEYVFNVKQMVDRLSIAGGFVGLGKYSQEIKDRLVTIVPQGKWESAFFILPAVSDDDNIGIGQVDLQVGLKSKNKSYNTQVVVWNREKGWVDKDARPRSVIVFPLMELAKDDQELKNIRFDVTANITVGKEVLQVSQELKTINGESAVSTPLNLVDVVSVQPDMLSFHTLNPASSLDFASITLTDGSRRFSRKLWPSSKGGVAVHPKPVYWLIAKNSGKLPDVKADILFNLNDGSIVKWKQNQKNLYDPEVGLDILLRDIDYAKAN